MVFSSMVFLWIFLPVSLVGGFVFQKIRLQNLFLLLMSLLFYAWGEPHYLILLLLSIGMNWAFGLWMERAPSHKKFVLVLSVLCNLALLGYYKYADFILNTLDAFLPGDDLPRLHLPLPIGISFFTFQAMSYVIDLYRGEYQAEKSLLDLALYISFFPQLIAGPIVKYRDIHEEIHNRQTVSLANLSTGARRFIYGLGKKVILSNLIASCATTFLSADQTQTSSLMAWTGVILYALQIYYDFSGYSDMAIGLGRMFGFHILENFNLPYISGSIQEFWRRWHMSLSGWFKEYLYIPLGGNRKGELRTCINLLIVFATTGLWHGASWNFVCWGRAAGLFQIFEKAPGFRSHLRTTGRSNRLVLLCGRQCQKGAPSPGSHVPSLSLFPYAENLLYQYDTAGLSGLWACGLRQRADSGSFFRSKDGVDRTEMEEFGSGMDLPVLHCAVCRDAACQSYL